LGKKKTISSCFI